MLTPERSHEDDVRGEVIPYEAPDEVTLKRVVTFSMVAAVLVIIISLVYMGIALKKEIDAGRAARTALSAQLSRAEAVILEEQRQQEEFDRRSQERLKSAVQQVTDAQKVVIEDTLRRELTTQLSGRVDEHEAILSEVRSR